MRKSFALLSLLALCFVAIGLTGCSKRNDVDRSKAVPVMAAQGGLSAAVVQAEFERDLQLLSEEPPRQFDVLKYAIKGSFDWDASLLRANVAITLKRQSGLRSIELDSHVDRVLGVRLVGSGPIDFTVNKEKSLLTLVVPESISADTLAFEIAYEVGGGSHSAQALSSNLTAVKPRLGDPVQSAVVFTHSEPRGASAWFPCNDRPADRALFSMELTMPAEQRLISNGRLIKDEVQGATRTMAYATDYSLPTYLMAFAEGDFVSATRMHGALPVSVWARRGLSVDWNAVLDETVREIAHYEKLLIPYPYEKYAIVLVPEFGGGIEHASITFNTEMSSSQATAGDFGLMAHELGHQWFGDYVTVQSWDDLWIKEGMATLLASDALRPYDDGDHYGILMANTFSVQKGDAIRDRALLPEHKYTSGPYGRAAWFLTQLRASVGERAFWAAMRENLQKHAFGNISSEAMLEPFRELLGEKAFAKALASIDTHDLPKLVAKAEGDAVSLSLEDEGGALLVPIDITEKSVAGEERHTSLMSGTSARLESKPGRLMSVDPLDVHVDLSIFAQGDKDSAALLAKVGQFAIPRTNEETKLFSTLSPRTQLQALSVGDRWSVSPEAFSRLRGHIHSETNKVLSLGLACAQAKKAAVGDERNAWLPILDDLFADPHLLGSHVQSHVAHNECSGQVPASVLQRAKQLAAHPESPLWSETEVIYLSSLPLGDGEFQLRRALALHAHSLRNRASALNSIAYAMLIPPAGEPTDPASRPNFEETKALLREMLGRTEMSELLQSPLYVEVKLKDPLALPPLAKLARSATSRLVVKKISVCAGFAISADDPAKKDEFLKSLGPAESLDESLQELLRDPVPNCKVYGF